MCVGESFSYVSFFRASVHRSTVFNLWVLVTSPVSTEIINLIFLPQGVPEGNMHNTTKLLLSVKAISSWKWPYQTFTLAWVHIPIHDSGHLHPGLKWPDLQPSSSHRPRNGDEGGPWGNVFWCPQRLELLGLVTFMVKIVWSVSNSSDDHQGMIPKSILQGTFDFLFRLTVKSNIGFSELWNEPSI